MKTGDKVRFLDDVGGGTIVGFQGDIVLVEDEDGFQIPTSKGNVVVVGAEMDQRNATFTGAAAHAKAAATPDGALETLGRQPGKAVSAAAEPPAEEEEALPVEERQGGNVLNCCLAFVPTDIKAFSTTAFECYFVNDSNYFIRLNILLANGAAWTLHTSCEVEPNTKTFIGELRREALNDYDRVCVQVQSYKRGKPFVLKPSQDVQLRLDPVKFYKLHAFVENDFFDEPALLYPVVEGDKAVRPLTLDAAAMKREMYSKSAAQEPRRRSPADGGYVRRYENGRGGNPFVIRHKGDEPVVINLHADSLLETTAGMSSSDILNYQVETFRKTMEKHKSEKGKRIVFIHGKGEGILRQALVHELQYRYKGCRYQDASFQEYGYGATQVTIR